ncbi:MAG: ribonuclease P protein component [Proteobacteria bacterium]|uniref:ribonuclease P protein component n=1 Tax=Brevundimonas sp. TaxID=1871086 RepID=UPI001AD212E4|nr:ribonuclease P protein component [Brevundimonas sp.]MBN9465696.1 ribonuclease P protein component [Brevundimonas sp.]MCA0368549.1 ribonuclease P protein component [Pseudomonadota bacterium]
MSDPLQIKRLLRRPQFLAAAKGVSEARGGVVIQRLERGDGSPHVGMGFTATRKIGGAVQRNRAKRRLRQAARALLPDHGVPGSDYVFIARMGTTERAWDRLLDDVKSTLTRLARPKADTPSPARAPSGQDRQNP